MLCVILVMAVNSGNTTEPQNHVRQFGDPAYKKLSRINGDINKMTKDQMKEKLAHLHLDTRYCTCCCLVKLQIVLYCKLVWKPKFGLVTVSFS